MAKNIEELKNSPVQQLDLSQFPERIEEPVEQKGTAEQEAANKAMDLLGSLTEGIEEQNKVMQEEIDEAKAVEDFISAEDEALGEKTNVENVEEDLSDDEEDTVVSVDFSQVSEEELDEDLKELLGEDVDNADMSAEQNEYINNFKNAIKEKIKPVSENMDISTFTVVNDPISINATLNDEVKDDVAWVLMSSNRSVHMERYLGSDIENLNPDPKVTGMGRLDTLRKVYRSLYEHITDVNKAASFEAWLKSTSYLDIKHLYAAVYRGAFEGSNYMTYECDDPSCGNIWLSDDIPMMDIVEFESDEIKEQFMELLEKESNPADSLYVSEIVPISEKYAISFREPSIYNVVFENASLPRKFTEKYEEMLSVMMYIDKIYFIDSVNKRLQPIALKEFANDMRKTTKVKTYTYSKILASLTSDEYNAIAKYMLAINKRKETVKYVKPACTCPKCGKVVEKEEQDMQSLLFNRASLVSILNA